MFVEAVPHDVTVCTVVRSDEPIERFLDALNEQSLPVPGYDLVIVDATPSGGLSALTRSLRYDVQVVRVEPDATHGAAWNAAWRAARGVGVAFLAADVFPNPIWVEYLARSLRRGRRLVVGRWLPTTSSLPQAGALSYRLWAHSHDARIVSTEQMGCRRADLEAVGGFDDAVTDPAACDMDLAIRLVESGVDPHFNRWMTCEYDIEPVDLATMLAARRQGADCVRMLAEHPGARGRLLSAGVMRSGAQPLAVLAVVGLLLMAKDRRAALLVAPWWHERTCVSPRAAGPRRKRFVLPGVFVFDVFDAVLGLAARLSSSSRS